MIIRKEQSSNNQSHPKVGELSKKIDEVNPKREDIKGVYKGSVSAAKQESCFPTNDY
jgi:hypothetical protein